MTESTTDQTTMRVGDHSLTIREITIDDIERLGRMFTRLSPDSVYRRFFSPIQQPSRTALLWLASVDHGRRDALVALDGDEIVAVARYDGRAGQSTAEIAVTVEDCLAAPRGRPTPHRSASPAVRSTTGSSRSRRVVQPDNRAALGLVAQARHPTRRCASTAASTRLEHPLCTMHARTDARAALNSSCRTLRCLALPFLLRTIDEPVDEAQTRPRVVDRAHLVVDEAVCETDVAHDALAQIGRHARGALRPHDPQTAGRSPFARPSVSKRRSNSASRVAKNNTTSCCPRAW